MVLQNPAIKDNNIVRNIIINSLQVLFILHKVSYYKGPIKINDPNEEIKRTILNYEFIRILARKGKLIGEAIS